jgi:hypothetical protein
MVDIINIISTMAIYRKLVAKAKRVVERKVMYGRSVVRPPKPAGYSLHPFSELATVLLN